MSEHYEIVPWFNSDEWHVVYKELSSENSNKHNALNLLEMWKARCPSLPSGIESTLSLLQVHVEDYKGKNDFGNDQMLRMAYSSAIMRFVNHMLDIETAKGFSLYTAAKNAGVPDWIVDLRHDAAHNHNLPSIALLRDACLISLRWLLNNYWDHHKCSIRDYCNSVDENKISTMIYFCSCISICSHSKIKTLADITDPAMQKSIINDASILFGDFMDLAELENVSIATLINLLSTNAKKIFKDTGSTFYVKKALLDSESLIISLELAEYLSENYFGNKKLSRSYVLCFEVFLSFLHTHDLILDFILALVKMTQTEASSKKAMLAALWISEILGALKKSKQFVERATKIHFAGAATKKKKDLKLLYHHWFPNEKLDGLILDLQKAVPKQLTDINYIQPIISAYNPYVTHFVKHILNLIEPNVPRQVSEKICQLAKLISAPDHFPADLTSAKIYTIQDLNSEDHLVDIDFNKIIKTGENNTNIQVQSINRVWKIASKQNWKSCPIGKIPWEEHQNVDIDME